MLLEKKGKRTPFLKVPLNAPGAGLQGYLRPTTNVRKKYRQN